MYQNNVINGTTLFINFAFPARQASIVYGKVYTFIARFPLTNPHVFQSKFTIKLNISVPGPDPVFFLPLDPGSGKSGSGMNIPESYLFPRV